MTPTQKLAITNYATDFGLTIHQMVEFPSGNVFVEWVESSFVEGFCPEGNKPKDWSEWERFNAPETPMETLKKQLIDWWKGYD